MRGIILISLLLVLIANAIGSSDIAKSEPTCSGGFILTKSGYMLCL